MPSPIETLLRVQPSPVPTQTTFGFFESIAIAPIDCTACLSNTGLYVVPPLTDFHTPPDAAPMYTVRRSPFSTFSWTASIAATRPLIAAEPMLRAPRPEIVSESTLIGAETGAGVVFVCASVRVGAEAAAAIAAARSRDFVG